MPTSARHHAAYPNAYLAACLTALGFCLSPPPALAQHVGLAYEIPPSIEYGDLYSAVELSSIFSDSKTFPDLIPDAAPSAVVAEYDAQKNQPGFSLSGFVAAHFSANPVPAGPDIQPAAPGTGLLDYVHSLWPMLTQENRTVPRYSTLQPLPYAYVVPGGRFREVYYWDSYFTSLGLEADGEHADAENLLRDFAYEIDRYGFVPNGSRSYYLSRSQPPFFSFLVTLLAQRDGNSVITRYLPELQQEYDFWMRGENAAAPGAAVRNVVKLSDGTVLNRYWDERAAPRDESYLEDVQTAAVTSRPKAVVWRNLRATAESGWDFSSRWLRDQIGLDTVRTLDIAPVDLNCLLVHLEQTLAQGYALEGDGQRATLYGDKAATRIAAIRRLLWDPSIRAFGDLLWRERRLTGELSAATLYPLFTQVATPAQAATVAATVQSKLLEIGGLATTLIESGQQWDAPNGWAPLQWIAVTGLRDYGFADLAHDIATRWVHKTIAGYEQQAKLVEKYNVTTKGGDAGGGGEYATQIGFGWTNGVLIALTALYPELHAQAAAAVPGGTIP